MKQKILKLAKNLERFKIEDIITLTELDEDTVHRYINELLSENRIGKISDEEYAYYPEINKIVKPALKDNSGKRYIYKIPIENDIVTNIAPKELMPKKSEFEFFNQAKDYNKKNIIKILTIFKLAKNLRGNSLNKFLHELGQRQPEYQLSYSAYLRYKYRYLKQGIKGLCLNYANDKTAKSAVSPEMYEEFKKYYLSPKKYSLAAVHKIICQKFPDSVIPSHTSFRRLLSKEYTSEGIEQLRNVPLKLPELSYTKEAKSEKEKIIFEKFIDAAEYYYKLLDKKKSESAICQKGYLKNHIVPYFKKYKFNEITQDIITNYQSKMVADGYSMASIRRFLSVLSILFTNYSNCKDDLYFVTDNNLIPPLEVSYYNREEIQEIIKNKKAELWILCLGITPAELSVLRYEDIDKKSKTIFVQRSVFQGKEQPHRAKYRQRYLKMPSILLNDIKHKTGLIFGKVEIPNYDKLINTHIHLLLKQNIQINIISKNLGFYNVKDFELRYNFLLPQQLEADFEILPKN